MWSGATWGSTRLGHRFCESPGSLAIPAPDRRAMSHRQHRHHTRRKRSNGRFPQHHPNGLIQWCHSDIPDKSPPVAVAMSRYVGPLYAVKGRTSQGPVVPARRSASAAPIPRRCLCPHALDRPTRRRIRSVQPKPAPCLTTPCAAEGGRDGPYIPTSFEVSRRRVRRGQPSQYDRPGRADPGPRTGRASAGQLASG
jgi:hypothetical protein